MPSQSSATPIERDRFEARLDSRLAFYPFDPDSLFVGISDPKELSLGEIEAIRHNVRCYNFSGFRVQQPALVDPASLLAFGDQLGLHHLDGNLCAEHNGISEIQVRKGQQGKDYIPYTDRPLSWHTDGYYNPPKRQVRAWILYCVRPAAEGGANALLDHEIAYLKLRQQDPQLIQALLAPDAFSIPPNEVDGIELRGWQSGPVFSLMADNRRLHMRFSARTTHVRWRGDEATAAARQALLDLISGPSEHILQYRLAAGEGFVSNNVLHNRSGFRDAGSPEQRRLLLRARYYDRIAGT